MVNYKVSIITCVFNRIKTIEYALESVKSQTYSNIEHIIIDGGSTDGTIQIIKNYIKNINYDHKFVSEKDKGIYDALNKGINISSGHIIGFLHSDDIFNSNSTIEELVKIIKQKNVDAIYGDLKYFYLKNNSRKYFRIWKSGLFKRIKLFYGWMPPHPTFFAQSHVYEEIGNFDTTFKISADYDFLLRFFLRAEFSSYYINDYISNMLEGGASNGSISKQIQKIIEDYKALKKNKFGFIFTPFLKKLRKLHQFLN